jgi:hypothetical protein
VILETSRLVCAAWAKELIWYSDVLVLKLFQLFVFGVSDIAGEMGSSTWGVCALAAAATTHIIRPWMDNSFIDPI